MSVEGAVLGKGRKGTAGLSSVPETTAQDGIDSGKRIKANYYPLPIGAVLWSIGVTGILNCRGSTVNASIEEILNQITWLCIPLHPFNSHEIPVSISTFSLGMLTAPSFLAVVGLNEVNIHKAFRLVSGKDPIHVSCKIWYFLNK